MLFVMLLAGVEKLINFAIQSDKITQLELEKLSGKSLRLIMHTPSLKIDTIFNDEGIRFEPVSESIFEDNQAIDFTAPDCSVIVDNPMELFNLIRSPEGNLPIEGDYKVLMQVRELMAGFDPDIVAQLEPFIGVAFASQLRYLLEQLQTNIADKAKTKLNDVSEWANELAIYEKNDPEKQQEFNSLNQKLLKLRSDIEREEARLQAIKAEQAKLKINITH